MANETGKTRSKKRAVADAAGTDQQKWVRVRIHRAIALGGLVFRPKIDGKQIVPVEAIMLAADATKHGKIYLEVLADVEAPADGIPHVIE